MLRGMGSSFTFLSFLSPPGCRDDLDLQNSPNTFEFTYIVALPSLRDSPQLQSIFSFTRPIPHSRTTIRTSAISTATYTEIRNNIAGLIKLHTLPKLFTTIKGPEFRWKAGYIYV
ncbi:hypothetical protein E2C01_099257 [Portunus trituberculatus]|uniref:Uncharacterized protein n=1 Tax=Portunus trituberculatus TaxID=210409 RepID=A0A5B7KGE5_PORTR|nr:hypothetical protein [Portunus trituberculatus]